jgi:transmembrane sensor
MADIHQLPDAGEILQQASAWIARLAADDVSPADRSQFQRWKAAHRHHAMAYKALDQVWKDCEAVGPLVRAVAFGQSMNEATRPKPRWLARVLVAASVLLAAALGIGAWHFVRPVSETFQTAVGEQATIRLPDGSSLELNSNSLVQVDYSPRSRVIYLLRGESYFEVAHNAQRPFWVVAGATAVKDVGTAFSVALRPGDVRVIVSNGVVDVGTKSAASGLLGQWPGKGPATPVTAGEQADIAGASVRIQMLTVAEVGRLTAWRSGMLEFDREPLADVLVEMSHYTTLRLVLQDPKLARMPIGGSFQASSQGPLTLVALLKDGFGLSIRQTDNTIYIGAAPTPHGYTSPRDAH